MLDGVVLWPVTTRRPQRFLRCPTGLGGRPPGGEIGGCSLAGGLVCDISGTAEVGSGAVMRGCLAVDSLGAARREHQPKEATDEQTGTGATPARTARTRD